MTETDQLGATVTCADLVGECCEECHDDVADDAGELQALEHEGQRATVCCAKVDAAREKIGAPAPPRVTVARNIR
ncbi:MAG TPA: hypothetical protein VEA16_06325 [Vicinamibacterales bacterium]|nr:hypothetical protein [Vicinamibacterales bacterium]